MQLKPKEMLIHDTDNHKNKPPHPPKRNQAGKNNPFANPSCGLAILHQRGQEIRRWKPDEEPRWCMRGRKQGDGMLVEKH